MEPYIELVKSLKLEKRLLPSNNPEISWFYIFLPALVAYLTLLSNYLNEKPSGGHLIAIQENKFWKIFPKNAAVEIIYRDNSSEVNSWYEGPMYVENDTGGYLLFSNTISNKIYRWEEGKGLFSVGRTIYSDYAGCYSNMTHCDAVKEPGSNGLLQVPVAYRSPKFPDAIDIFVCQHGERAIGLLRENGTRAAIATHYRNRRFNSPNDIILTPEGHIYFTDPPYGLYHKESNKIQYKELPFNGIYFIDGVSLSESIKSGQPANAAVKLMNKDMTRPNGMAFSPDFSKIYVSNSDPKNSFWRVFHVQENGNLKTGNVLYNYTAAIGDAEPEPGLPDGLKVDIYGNIFASGPGGVIIFSEEGEILGKIKLHERASNIAFGTDGRLYITMSHSFARVRVNTKPVRILSKINRK